MGRLQNIPGPKVGPGGQGENIYYHDNGMWRGTGCGIVGGADQPTALVVPHVSLKAHSSRRTSWELLCGSLELTGCNPQLPHRVIHGSHGHEMELQPTT
jgi:hypothetical protein